MFNLGMKFLKDAWRHFKMGKTPKSYDDIGEGFSNFIKENCGCTFLQ